MLSLFSDFDITPIAGSGYEIGVTPATLVTYRPHRFAGFPFSQSGRL